MWHIRELSSREWVLTGHRVYEFGQTLVYGYFLDELSIKLF